jgi:hypothetical protein
MLRRLLIIKFIGLYFVFLAPGCLEQDQQLRTFCSQDADCPPGYRCDPKSGLCLCATDEVCKPDEYCAPDGRCRKRMSCDTNLDCPEDMFCDSTTGNCIELGRCTKDEQCPLGEICSELFECKPGCRTSGGCPLTYVCREGDCLSGGCDDKSYCDYGQLCDVELDSCYVASGPFCDLCQPVNVSNPYRCGPGPNFCIMTNNDPSLEPFCGVDCNAGQECPNGYSCSLILTAPGQSCDSNDDCASDECHINEGDTVGFCLCVLDSECPQDSCDDFASQCRITRKPCIPGGNDCDRPIYCIDGLCLIGRNCTPIEGLDCADFGK